MRPLDLDGGVAGSLAEKLLEYFRGGVDWRRVGAGRRYSSHDSPLRTERHPENAQRSVGTHPNIERTWLPPFGARSRIPAQVDIAQQEVLCVGGAFKVDVDRS